MDTQTKWTNRLLNIITPTETYFYGFDQILRGNIIRWWDLNCIALMVSNVGREMSFCPNSIFREQGTKAVAPNHGSGYHNYSKSICRVLPKK